METTKKSRQRKMLWALPVLIVPFVTLLFWSMGGGTSSTLDGAIKDRGFNSKLPETTLSEESYNKLNYYDKAELDSTKQEDLRKKDPFFGASASETLNEDIPEGGGADRLQMNTFRNSNEQAVMQRLQALQHAMEQPVKKESRFPVQRPSNETVAEVSRMEALMASMQPSEGEDREMQQINGMLESILDIQHPQRVQERLKKEQRSKTGAPLAIASPENETIIGNLGAAQGFEPLIAGNNFYSLEDTYAKGSAENAIAATIAESQACVNGSTVKLRLSQEVAINGIRIPQNTFVYGVASLKGERLNIEVNSIRYQNSLYPVELILYDIDGLEGIFIPGAISRDVAKASADRSMQGIGITTVDDGWGAQAAGAGLEAAKSLFSKKVKLVKVQVKAGYQVLLKEKKVNNN